MTMMSDSARIDALLAKSTYHRLKLGEKTYVVVCRLPNGFEITASSACVDPQAFDAKVGEEICMRRIQDKLWELEAYAAHVRKWEEAEQVRRHFPQLELVKKGVDWLDAYAAIYKSPTARIRIPGWVPGLMVMAGQASERGMLIIVDRRGAECRWIPCDREVQCNQWEVWDTIKHTNGGEME